VSVFRIAAIFLFAGSAGAQQLTQQEMGVFDALNRLRRDPAGFIRTLEAQRSFYRGNFFSPPGQVPIRTTEGVKAVDEAIGALRALRHPLSALSLSRGLARAAAQHVRDTGGSGMLGHNSPDGGSFAQRISRFGQWSGSVAESITYGDADPTGVISQLVVDDGVRDRGHRATLLDPQWSYTGISCGAHAVYRGMCVLDFAVSFEEK
jgi:uncharacterized protein YkwD